MRIDITREPILGGISLFLRRVFLVPLMLRIPSWTHPLQETSGHLNKEVFKRSQRLTIFPKDLIRII